MNKTLHEKTIHGSSFHFQMLMNVRRVLMIVIKMQHAQIQKDPSAVHVTMGSREVEPHAQVKFIFSKRKDLP